MEDGMIRDGSTGSGDHTTSPARIVAGHESPAGEDAPPLANPRRARLAKHPWRALLVILALQPVCYALVGLVLYGVLRLPRDLSNMESFSTSLLFTVGGLLAYLVVPFLLHLPMGGRTITQYLDDIRLTRVRPVVPLLVLTLSCDLVLILCMGSGSLVYRLSEGKPLTGEFVRHVFDLSLALPPQSMLLFAQFFSSFEEVLFRGVFLTMLLATLSARRAIVYSALAFGLMHLPAVLAGQPLVPTLGQVVWAFLFGLFYGYLFLQSGSLLPPMIIHWLSNVFQAPLTAYWWHTAPAPLNTLYGIVFGYGLATLLLLPWVRFFCARWLPRPSGATAYPQPQALTQRP
jgi:membrane protease YdiL (CAAX protease family)